MRLWNKLFGKKEKESEYNVIFFHEDLYCQVEILPRENIINLDLENEKIKDFGELHNDGGLGYTDIYMRGEQKNKTSERKIRLADFENLILENRFLKKDAVYTGYGNTQEKCNTTNAYFLDSAVIYCDFGENDIIQNIWLDGFRFNKKSAHKTLIIKVLNEVGKKYNLILNDWDLCEKIDLEVQDDIKSYIEEK